MSARHAVAASVLAAAVAGVGAGPATAVGRVPVGVGTAPTRLGAAADAPYVVTDFALDRTTVRVSGLDTVPVRVTMRIRGGAGSTDFALVLRQERADGRPSSPVRVRVPLRPLAMPYESTDPEKTETFTGVLHVSAGVGPRLVADGVVHTAYDDPGEICMGSLDSPECGGSTPVSGPSISVTTSHRPVLRVRTTPRVPVLPVTASTAPRVRLDVSVVDQDTGRPFVTREPLAVDVGFRTRSGGCRDDQNIPLLTLSPRGTATKTVNTRPSIGVASSLDEAAHCAVLLGSAKDDLGERARIVQVDNVMRFAAPVRVTAPARWRADRSIPITASVRTYAGLPGTMRIQRLHGRSVWRTVGLTRMRSNGDGFEYRGSMRIPAKGKGTAVYRVQVFSADESSPFTTSTSSTFRVR